MGKVYKIYFQNQNGENDMPIFKEQGSYNGVDFKLTHYVGTESSRDLKLESSGVSISKISGCSEDSDEVFAEINRRSEEIKKQMYDDFGEFKEIRQRPEDLLHDYGKNDFIIEYWRSNQLSGFECGSVIEAETESGEQALDLMGHLINLVGRFPVQIPLSAMNFHVSGAQSNGRRCANMITGACHPPSVDDMCNIYVAEKGYEI